MTVPIRLLTAISVMWCVPAFAQAPNSPAPLQTPSSPAQGTDAKACSQQRLAVGPDGKPQAETSGAGDLSDKLARSGGVICPPAHVDPDIKAPTPPGGRMPVIPPPGSPGGDPTQQPK